MPIVALLFVLLICASGYAASADIGYLELLVGNIRGSWWGAFLAIPEFRSMQSTIPERVFIFTLASQFIVPAMAVAWGFFLRSERKETQSANFSGLVRWVFLALAALMVIYYFYLLDGYSMVSETSSIASIFLKDAFVSIMASTFFAFFLPAKWKLRRNSHVR